MLQYESLPLSHTLSVSADEKRLDLLLALHQFPFSFTFCSRRQSLSVLSSQQFFLRSMTYVVHFVRVMLQMSSLGRPMVRPALYLTVGGHHLIRQ